MKANRIPQLLSIFFTLHFTSCEQSKNEVVVYNTVDQLISEPVLLEFEKETGIKVRTVFDTEETKSTGILNRIIAESGNPRCDVFWSGDPLRTQVLLRKGLLEKYISPVAGDIDTIYKDSGGRWTGFSSRARVILYNKNKMHPDSAPRSVFDLTHPRFKGKAAIANPLFGTTTFHIAALFSVLGEERGKKFMQALKENQVVIAASNGDVKRRVIRGDIPCGLTDTDDAFAALESGAPVGVIYPDQDSLGTLIMPNTVSLIHGSPNTANGKKLMDYLLSKKTEEKLAASCGQMPLHAGVKTPRYVPSVKNVRAMQVNFTDVAAWHETLQPYLKQWSGKK